MDKICEKHNPCGWIDYKSRIEWNLIDAILEDLVEEAMTNGQILIAGNSGFTKSKYPLEEKDIQANRNTILHTNLEYAQSIKLVTLNLVSPETDLEDLIGILEKANCLDSDSKREFLIQSFQGSFQFREHCIQAIVKRELSITDNQMIRCQLDRKERNILLQSVRKNLTSERASRIIEDARQEYNLKLLARKSARANIRTIAIKYALTRKGIAYVEYGRLKRWVMRVTSFLNPTWFIFGAIAGAKPFLESFIEGGSWLYTLSQRIFEFVQSSGTLG